MIQIVSNQPISRLQRSHVEHKPKLVVGVMAFGIAAGTMSCIVFFENSSAKCDADSYAFATEPISGIKFPSQLVGYDKSSEVHWLVSKTVRCMLNFCSIERARAYAYGIYFSSEATKKCKNCTSCDEIASTLLPLEACSKDTPANKLPAFIPASSFQGAKNHYYFGRDDLKGGLGYHLDAEALVLNAARSSYPSLGLRLVMLRQVEGKHIGHGFDRSFLGRIRQAQESK